MSKYDELASIAISCSEKHFAIKRKCQKLAYKITKGYQVYLGAPSDTINNLVLNAPFESSGKLETPSALTPIVKGDDSYWYFVIRVELKSSSSFAFMYENIHIGIKISDDTFHIKHECDFKIPKSDTPDFYEFYNFLYEDSKERYFKGKPSKNIGFVINE